MQAGKLIEAAAVAGQLQTANPSDVDILYAAHWVYTELANSTLYSIAVLGPDSARMYQAKGDELAQQGNTQAAIAAYRQALERDPHLPGAHYELAEIMSASTSAAEREQAEAEYKSALADNPLDEKTECGLGALQLQRSNFQAASESYAEAVRLQPDDPAANEGLGTTLVSLGEWKKAKPYLEHAVKLDPENGRAHYHLSLLDRELSDVPAAKHEMDEFLRLKVEQGRIVQALKDMHGQLLTQIQKDRNVDASMDAVPK
jgi:tetratricopeptide (TPR) repeat protein